MSMCRYTVLSVDVQCLPFFPFSSQDVTDSGDDTRQDPWVPESLHQSYHDKRTVKTHGQLSPVVTLVIVEY